MNRVIAVTAMVATATVAGTMAAAIVPAMASPRPVTAHAAAHSAHPAARTATADHTATAARPKAAAAQGVNPPTVINSQLDGGKYVTVVRCQGVDSPPPVTVGKPGTPLTVHGEDPSAAVVTKLKKVSPYKTIYTCTVVVQEKVPVKPPKAGCEIKAAKAGTRPCSKPVTLNTGFGGLAPQVKDHRPVD
ncbi:MAG TPA: hypothetical protein VGG83_21970 [Trebonia sp.]|jgi:hypothetical protein